MNKKNVLSAVQPTAGLHIGNLFGAIQNWVLLQDIYPCLYMVADLHSITVNYSPVELRKNTENMVIDLLACGIDPDKSILFIQSLVPEHTELCWILSCFCSYGDLERMTQFKDKSKHVDMISSGLFMYPVLQAADILLYKGELIPVGKDQEQHLELSREIVRRFNNKFGCEYFPEPQPLFSETQKIMSLASPDEKMSKSKGQKAYIGIFDNKNDIERKIQAAVTDSGKTNNSGEMSPGVKNLFSILKGCKQEDDIRLFLKEHDAGTLKYLQLKEAVIDSLTKLTKELRYRRKEIEKDTIFLNKKINIMSEKAREIARTTLRDVRSIVGLPKNCRSK